MAAWGALGEGFDGRGARPGEYLCRGVASISSGTLTITLPAPIRLVTHAVATIKMASALNSGLDPLLATVGSYSGNTFVLYLWKPTASGNVTLIASTHTVSVEWAAWGNIYGVDPVENQS